MEVKKDIGKAIREKLDSLDRQPGDALWSSINEELDQKKKRKFSFFWFFSIASIAIAITAFIIFRAYGPYENSSPELKNINPAGISDSPGAASATNPSGDGKTIENHSTTNSSKSQSGNDNTINVTNGAKNNTPYNNNTRQSGIKEETTSKHSIPKNNVAARNTKQVKQYHDGATVNKGKTAKNRDTQKHNPTLSYPTVAKASSASGKENTVSDTTTTAIVNNGNNKSTSQQSADYTQEKQNDNLPVNSNTSIKTKGETEIVTRERAPVSGTDSLPENIMAKDSLKTELLKETVEEKKEENKKDSIPPVPFKKFSVFAYGGPSYFSFPDSAVVTDSTTSNINTKSTIRFGVLFGYKFNSKLSIRTGLSYHTLKQSASGIKLNYVMGGSVTNPGLIPTPDFTWIGYQQPFGTNSGVIISNLGDNYMAIINIDRELSYLEIPLEISYNLFDRKFGLNLLGGGSMLLLNKNEVFAYNENGKMYLGEWNAAAKTSFSGTLGLGLNYKLTPSLQLNAEPVFNYYFNTYKDSKPYSFTIRFGLQYNFDF